MVECKSPSSLVCHSSPSDRSDRAGAGGQRWGFESQGSSGVYIFLDVVRGVAEFHLYISKALVERGDGGQESEAVSIVKSKVGGREEMVPKVREFDQYIKD